MNNNKTSGPGNDFLVYVAQFINHEDAAANFDATHNGDNIPEMPEAGGGGTYVETVEQLSPSQRQTYDGLVVGITILPIALALTIFVAVMVRRIRKPTQFRQRAR